MRHRRKNNHLGRKKGHREAMLSNMATSLIMHKRIYTTVPKAKELRRFVEPLITRSKEDTTHSRRVVFSALRNKYAVTELFQTVSQKIGDRPGGYTRIIKTGYRLGDNAPMCFIELVDFNENMLKETGPKRTRTRRSRRKSTAKTAGAAASTTGAATSAADTSVADVEAKGEVKAEKAEKAKGKATGESTKKAKQDNVKAKAEEVQEVKAAAETSAEETPQAETASTEKVEKKEEKEDKKEEKPQDKAEADEDTKG
mgnify:CR=1 FL=1